MIRESKIARLLALLFAFTLVAAACSGSDSEGAEEESTDTTEESTDEGTDTTEEETDTEEPSDGAGGSVAYGNAQEFSNYNNNLAAANSVKNGIVLNQVLPQPFYFAGPGGGLVMDSELLDSAEIIGEDPQVLQYVINADASWSDGEPIDCDDFMLQYEASRGFWQELDESGDPVIDAETELPASLFLTVGTTGYDQITAAECSEDGKTVTFTFDPLYAEWQGLIDEIVPAHVVAREAGVDDMLAAFAAEDYEQVSAMADVFNNVWAMNPGELLDESLIPSGGKYKLGSWEAGSSLTLEPNEAYWGTPANGPTVIRYIAEEAQAQALANGEINAMDPQPTPDLLAQLQGTEGVTVESGNQFIWEHFDFNFNNEALQNRDVREAFALCLPRQQMVANLIQPLSPDAVILNNRTVQEFEDGYEDASGGAYDAVDIARATELLANSGVSLPIDIRLGWFDNGGNARRTDQVALTVESCNQVEGFNIIDSGSETFFDVELDAGDWDIAMFAWAGSPLKSGLRSLFGTGQAQNIGNYSNPEVDALGDAIAQELDAVRVIELANEMDAILWEDLATIPVFSFPGVVAYSDNADGVVYNPSQNGLTWNAADWQLN